MPTARPPSGEQPGGAGRADDARAGQVEAGQGVQVHVGAAVPRRETPAATAGGVRGSAGRGKWTTKWKRRVNAGSMLSRRLLARITRPSWPPGAGAGSRPRGWRTGRCRAGPRRACRTARRPRRRSSTAWLSSACRNAASRFFSVSPTHLETTWARSTLSSWRPSMAGDDLGGQGLAGAGIAGEQRLDPAAHR